MYVTSSQVTPRGGKRHTVGHVMGAKADHTTLQCCHSHACSSILSTTTDKAAHTHCLFTNIQLTPQEDSTHAVYTPCRHTAAHTTGGEYFTDNAGTRQLTPRVENNSQTMSAHGSSHHRWRIIHRQCRHSAALTTGGE